MEVLQVMIEFQQNEVDSQYSQTFSYHASYTLFLEQPIEEKSELEKSIKAMQEAERKFQKMLASPIPQYFQDLYSVSLFQNDQTSVLDTCINSFMSPSDNLKTCWTDNLYIFFKTKISILPF